MQQDLDNLDNLKAAWDTLLACQQAAKLDASDQVFEAYLSALDDYLTAHQVRFKKPKEPGVASLDNLERYLKNTQSLYVLKQLQANRDHDYFELSDTHLQIPLDSEEQFATAISEVEGRLTEAFAQLNALNHTEQDLKSMLKYGFGKKNVEGIVVTPDKTAIGNALVELIPPSQKSLKRDRKGDIIPFQTL